MKPLLLLPSLPAREAWHEAIGSDPDEKDGGELATAVAGCYDHQSQAATDCRWVRVTFALFAERMIAPPEIVTMLAEYHTHSEEQMRLSRAQIRSLEIAFAGDWDSGEWPRQFWQECLEGSPCLLPDFDQEAWMAKHDRGQLLKDKERLGQINQRLTDRFWETCNTTDLEPQHEVAFGIAHYCAELVTSSILMGMGMAPQGRMTLRALVECVITLRFLRLKNEPELWAAFMSHGQGQAKLVHHRMEETAREPGYLNKAALHQIANDDVWTEFLTIEIGHWGGIDLRKMAEFAGLKDVYDDYYTWPSGFAHGQWGAIRESVITPCQNPLHRFHRIPAVAPTDLQDCRTDCFLLLEMVISELDVLYPPDAGLCTA